MTARIVAIALALVAGLGGADAAAGDGLPVPVDDAGPTGVSSADARSRYVTVDAGRGTVIERVARPGGAVARYAFLHGTFTIPVVALDGTAAGLAHDESTLVLIRPRRGFPRARTTLAILGARSLRTHRVVTLRGDFSFDALSPDGRTAYLVQYTDPRDPTQYLVRALDARSGRLLPDPVVDPHEDADEMAGMPLTRTVSADGRWHYTLYHKDSGAFFVHALDTRARRAKCVDLPALPNSDYMYGFRLALGAGGLSVNGPKGPMAVVDTSSFRVTKAAPRTEAPAAVGARGDSGSAAPWVAGFAALMAAGLAVVWLWRRRATDGRTALNG